MLLVASVLAKEEHSVSVLGKENITGAQAPVAIRISAAEETKDHDHEVEIPEEIARLPYKNKLTLMLVEGTVGCLGVDRCYLAGCRGNGCAMGTVKGITLGGLGIWALIDWAIVMGNGFSKDLFLDSMGMQGNFS